MSNHDKKEKPVKQVWTQKVVLKYFGLIDRNFDWTGIESKRTWNESNQKEKVFFLKSSIYSQNFRSIGVGLAIEKLVGVGCHLFGRKS
jgi:NRPS condensation-like uncharacterized protein